jgi:hypothetical protein
VVHELDPHFVDELFERWAAEAELAEKQRKESDKRRKQNEAKRKR